jgi:NadR type nicotinamide-nucleotide adenylyltransferase
MRIAITGPESSGKTSLAQALAKELNAVWIPEFARKYLEERNGNYTVDDLSIIAESQVNEWNKAPSSSYLICDTEMIVMKVWSDFKYGSTPQGILKLLDEQEFDHYFLCKPDIPWEEDPLREHPEQREELYAIYLNELKSRNLSFTIIEGTLDNRLKICLKTIRDEISHL